MKREMRFVCEIVIIGILFRNFLGDDFPVIYAIYAALLGLYFAPFCIIRDFKKLDRKPFIWSFLKNFLLFSILVFSIITLHTPNKVVATTFTIISIINILFAIVDYIVNGERERESLLLRLLLFPLFRVL